jgi:hypothetical protein
MDLQLSGFSFWLLSVILEYTRARSPLRQEACSSPYTSRHARYGTRYIHRVFSVQGLFVGPGGARAGDSSFDMYQYTYRSTYVCSGWVLLLQRLLSNPNRRAGEHDRHLYARSPPPSCLRPQALLVACPVWLAYGLLITNSALSRGERALALLETS